MQDFIAAIRSEFKDENWEYLDFIADRVLDKESSDISPIDYVPYVLSPLEEAGSDYIKPFYGLEHNSIISKLYVAFKNGATWQREQLQPIIDEMLVALNKADSILEGNKYYEESLDKKQILSAISKAESLNN